MEKLDPLSLAFGLLGGGGGSKTEVSTQLTTSQQQGLVFNPIISIESSDISPDIKSELSPSGPPVYQTTTQTQVDERQTPGLPSLSLGGSGEGDVLPSATTADTGFSFDMLQNPMVLVLLALGAFVMFAPMLKKKKKRA